MRFPTAVSLTVYPVFMYDFVPLYLSLHPFVNAAPPFLPPPTAMFPHFELGLTPQWWPPGALLGTHKFTDNVLHRGFSFTLEGHDLGPVIPHVCIPPTNPMLIPTIIGASRKVKFTAGEVRANGKGVACCYLTPMPFPRIPSPMVFCSKPCALPLSGTGIAPLLSSAIVGQHWIDILADAVGLIAESVLSAILSSNAAPDPTSWSAQGNDAARDFAIGGDTDDSLAKAGRGALPGTVGNLLRGLIRLGGQEVSDYRGPGGVNLGANMGPAQAGWHSTRDYNSAGEERWSHGGDFQVGGDGINLHGSAGASQNDAGAWTGEGAAGVGAMGENIEGRYSTDRPDDVGGGEGFYGRTEGPLVPDQNFGGSPRSTAPSGTPSPESLPEL